MFHFCWHKWSVWGEVYNGCGGTKQARICKKCAAVQTKIVEDCT